MPPIGHVNPGFLIRTQGISVMTNEDLSVIITANGNTVTLSQEQYLALHRLQGLLTNYDYE